MKVFGAAIVAASVMQTASAHYIWNTVNGGSAYQYFRTNTNYNSPVTDTSSNDIRCNVGASTGGSTGTLTVAAGGKVTLGLDIAVYHQGPHMFYLGKVPSGQTASSWDGSGANWYKFYEIAPDFSKGGNGAVDWKMSNKYDITIPSGTAAGTYLLRAEQIGLHNPGSPPQFYVGCAQIQVTGGGSCSPSTFSIPGHIKSSDASLQVNIYSGFSSYSMPGPAVASCNGGGSNTGGGSPTTTRTTTRAAGTTMTTRTTTAAVRTTTAAAVTTTPASNGCSTARYGQCGGTGFNGCSTCSGSTCVKLNDYYSQCQ